MLSVVLLRRLAALLALLCLHPCARASGPGDAVRGEPEAAVRWYTLELSGVRVGSVREAVERRGPNWLSASRMEMAIRRGALELEFNIETAFEETPSGEPVRAMYRHDMGGGVSETVWEFGEDSIEVIERTWQPGADAGPGGDEPRTRRRTEPMVGGEWLTPLEAAEFVRHRLRAGAEEIAVRTLDPSAGLRTITVTRREIEPDRMEVGGQVIPVWRCVTRTSGLGAAPMNEVLDAAGVSVRSEYRMGAMTVVATLSDRASAAEPAGELPELMVSTFVSPSRPIERPRASRRAVYEVRLVREADLPGFEPPAAGFQRVAAVRPGAGDRDESDGRDVEAGGDARAPAWRVLVDLDGRGEVARIEPGEWAAFLEASSLVTSDDPVVRRLAESVGGDAAADPAAVAEGLRRLVYGHIDRKRLSVAFGTAAQVARTREGDCTEHAVLLAALLRARGVPSRVVSGLVYADQFAGAEDVFAYHLWTQAALPAGSPDADAAAGGGGPGEEHLRWVDLDATLPGRSYDAAHIALGVSPLTNDEPMGGLMELASVLGLLEIEVIEVGHGTGAGREPAAAGAVSP